MTVRNWSRHFAVFSATLWVGGMWVIAYLAVPMLFQTLADRQLAGMLAGKLFIWMAFAGIGCALYLLAYRFYEFGRSVWKEQVFLVIVAMLILVVIGQFGIQPVMADMKSQALPLDVMQSTLAPQFKELHGIASILYLIQSLLGGLLVVRLFAIKNI